jgi:hypothetical protein
MKAQMHVVIGMMAAALLACTGGADTGTAPTQVPAVIDQPAATEQPAIDVSGSYTVNGTNPNGSPYTGTAAIHANGDGSYTMTWTITDTEAYSGKGSVSGNIFTVNWTAGSLLGTATYTIQSDGSMVGTWSTSDGSQSGTETLTP